ncbi:MAG: hypothetical protein KF802_11985 [Bdellovibrionaceae bacterium]|nr:hypothetical protein [Pseudobdellovibrionaceae bacterium]MBX3032834.1 hypothetical protein [Pseudobdellovibrionaceae bacterium]
MKNMALLFVLASVFSFNAHATKARRASLLGAAHVVDSQSIFHYPSEVNLLGQYVTIEFGPTADGVTEPKAEGGLFRKADEATWGLYLGHHDATQTGLRALNTYQNQTNPIQLFYGKGNWGATVGLSNTDKKTTKAKETTVYAGFGQSLDSLTWGANAQVIASAEKLNGTDTDKYTGAPVISAQMRTHGDVYYHGGINYGDVKHAPGAAGAAEVKVKDMNVELGVVDRTLKTDDRDLYYGVSLVYTDRESGGKHLKTQSLPVSIGFEQTLNSWATARASLQQNFLLGSVKDETKAAPLDEADSIANNTTVSAGLGFKYGALTVDGVLSAATTGDMNGNAILAKTGLVYSF